MKVLFAVSNEEISESIVKKYQKEYKEIISYKNVYYFNAILKELQKDKTYDRVVISEDLESFTNTQYDQIDKFIFEKLDSISDEASNTRGNDIPIILICSDRRTKSEQLLVKLFGIGIYDAIIGNDRSVEEVCKLINRPRLKKEAKSYYKIDSEEVNYQAENENDVSEMEIQNIVAHYKRLGKNEDKYIESFNNIAAQYNDVQLRIITKFLPLNVRAVLEEKSPKYQQIMSFNSSVSNSLRYQGKKPEEKSGPSEKLLTQTTNNEKRIAEPIVIPSSVNMTGNVKLSRKKPVEQKNMDESEEFEDFEELNELPGIEDIQETTNQNVEQQYNNDNSNNDNYEDDDFDPDDAFNQLFEALDEEDVSDTEVKEDEDKIEEQEVIEPVKRGRGRPRKNPAQEENTEPTVKRGRGRPRKNPIQEPAVIEEDDDNFGILPGFDDEENDDTTSLPGFDDKEVDNTILPGFDDEEDTILPGFDDEENNDTTLPGFEDEANDDTTLPGFEDETNDDTILPGFDDEDDLFSNVDNVDNNIPQQQSYEENHKEQYNYNQYNDQHQTAFDLSSLLTPDKKIVSFVGTSKSGTSFIVNNIAEYMSSVMGVNTVILDTTKNRNSYYIYTKNEEQLRVTAAQSIQGLTKGLTQGINVNKNLTVYTALPDEDETINNFGEILETLVKNYSLILIDTDFDTPLGYFEQSQEIYLVQTLDVLTIQPLTAFLRDLKAKNILDEEKLRIILNKTVNIRGINDKTIIGGMAYYNDPAMSFMTELFDRNSIKYISIPFEQEIYTKYLQGIIECEITLKGYSKTFMQILQSLSNMIYPISSSKNNTYTPPSVGNRNANSFSPNMNNTLEQMRKNF